MKQVLMKKWRDFADQLAAYTTVLWLRQRRRPLWLLAEVLLPVLFSLVILLIRHNATPVKRVDRVFKAFPVFGNCLDLFTPVDGVPLLTTMFYYDTLYYAPKNKDTDRIMNAVKDRYNWKNVIAEPILPYFNQTADILLMGYTLQQVCLEFLMIPIADELQRVCDAMRFYTLNIRAFDTEQQMVADAVDADTSNRYIAAVVFDEHPGDSLSHRVRLRFRYYHRHLLPQHFSRGLVYDWATSDILPDGLAPIGLKQPQLDDGGLPAYWREMFLSVEKAIGFAIVTDAASEDNSRLEIVQNDYGTLLERFPYPAHKTHPLRDHGHTLVPLLLVVSFMIPVLYSARTLAVDRERGIKTYLHIMGVAHVPYWTAHFLLNAAKAALTSALLSAVLLLIFPDTHPLAVFTLVALYSLYALGFSCAISSLFQSGTTATVSATVLWFALYIPTLYLQRGAQPTDRRTRLALCLLPNTAAMLAAQLFAVFTADGGIATLTAVREDVCLLDIFLVLALDVVLVYLIHITAEVYRCWQTLFTASRNPSYLTPRQAFGATIAEDEYSIRVRNLSVVLGSRRQGFTVAARDVGFDAQSGRITVLLGRNGSGKTTVLSVLAGVIPATEGQITIGKYDADSERNSLQKHIAYCPQYNPLFDYLTVKEHLNFYCKIKGTTFKLARAGAMLDRLKLWHKRFAQARFLSGGMRRKLCLAIALTSDAEVVLLDEPTSGVDADARREIQALLLAERHKRRLVLMTTHYMDEADILGDYVLLLHRGRLLDKGSSRMLRRKCGEYLNLYISFNVGKMEKFTGEISQLVKEYYPDSIESFCDERCLLMRLETYKLSWETLSDICCQLDRDRSRLYISSIQADITTLDDVFRRQTANTSEKGDVLTKSAASVDDFMVGDDGLSGLRLSLERLKAMTIKKLLLVQQNWLFLIFQLLLPPAVVFLGILVNKLNRRYQPEVPALELTDIGVYSGSSAMLLAAANLTAATDELTSQITRTLVAAGVRVISPNIRPSDSLTSHLLSSARYQGPDAFMRQLYLAVSVNETEVHLYFNNLAPHSAAAGLALILDASVKTVLGVDSRLRIYNHPLPPQFLVYFLFGEEFVLALCLSLGLLLFSSMLRKTGVSAMIYWLPHVTIDGLLCTCSNLTVLATLWVNGVSFLTDGDGVTYTFLVLQAHSWALLPIVYCCSFFRSSPVNAMAKLIIVNVALALIPTCASSALTALSFDAGQSHLRQLEADTAQWISAALPQFAVGKALMVLYSNRLMRHQCGRLNRSCDQLGTSFSTTSDPLQWAVPGIGRLVVCMLLQGVLLWALLILLETSVFAKVKRQLRLLKRHSAAARADDTRLFTRTGSLGGGSKAVIAVTNLTVYHQNVEKPTVNDLSLRVSSGECVCLVGANGAGKTSVFRAIMGLQAIEPRMASIEGIDVVKEPVEALSQVGYCAQFDALLEQLSVVDNLRLFGRLRGFPSSRLTPAVFSLINMLGLAPYAWKPVNQLSGGNQRKTSLALAMIGGPSALILDEPTAGVDPTGRTIVGSLLNRMREHGTAILMSSHSADVLGSTATSVAQLESGRLRDGGLRPMRELAATPTGFRLTLTASSDVGVAQIDELVAARFPEHTLQPTVNSTSRSLLVAADDGGCWKLVLEFMQVAQDRLRLHDFSIAEQFFDDLVLTSPSAN